MEGLRTVLKGAENSNRGAKDSNRVGAVIWGS